MNGRGEIPETPQRTDLPDGEARSLKAQLAGRSGEWSLHLADGRLCWTDATCTLFGITRAEFNGTFHQFRGLVLAEDLAAYDIAHGRAAPDQPHVEVEFRVRLPDGSVRWLYERGLAEFDDSGVPVQRVGIVMDISDRQVRREQLAQNAAVLAQIAGRVARLGGWAIELPERTLTWSDENCAIHDVPPGYVPTLEEGINYFPSEHRDEVRRLVEICATEGTPYDFELPKFTATGRLIWVRSIGEAVRDADGTIIRLQGAFQDITARKQVEAEKEALITELRDALAEVKTLREFLPICSYCMKVRDDQNFWSRIENYISKHTGTRFTHGICPDCYAKNVAPELEHFKEIMVRDRKPDK